MTSQTRDGPGSRMATMRSPAGAQDSDRRSSSLISARSPVVGAKSQVLPPSSLGSAAKAREEPSGDQASDLGSLMSVRSSVNCPLSGGMRYKFQRSSSLAWPSTPTDRGDAKNATCSPSGRQAGKSARPVALQSDSSLKWPARSKAWSPSRTTIPIGSTPSAETNATPWQIRLPQPNAATVPPGSQLYWLT